MRLESAKAIIAAADVLGDAELRLHEDYSGRSMYGNTTVAISGDKDRIMQAVIYAAFEMGRDGKDDIDDFLTDTVFKWDNLGYDAIAY